MIYIVIVHLYWVHIPQWKIRKALKENLCDSEGADCLMMNPCMVHTFFFVSTVQKEKFVIRLYSPLLCKSVPLGCSSRQHFWKCSLVHLPAHQNQSLQSLSHQILRWFHPRSIRDRCATLYSNSSWKNDVDTIFNLKPINKGKNGIKHDSNKRTGIFKGNKI